jgi:hypothetical protein
VNPQETAKAIIKILRAHIKGVCVIIITTRCGHQLSQAHFINTLEKKKEPRNCYEQKHGQVVSIITKSNLSQIII